MITVPIKDFVPNQQAEGYYLVKWKEVKTGSNNKPYIDYIFADLTGVINVKHWSPVAGHDYDFSAGQVVRAKLAVIEYNGAPQAKIVKIQHISDADQVDMSQIVPSAPIPPQEMYDEIYQTAAEISDQDLRKVVLTVLERNYEKLLYWPAAKTNHHAIRSGLLYHTLRMLRSAMALCKVYENVDSNYVCAGVILHDMEKIREMNSSELGVVDEYTRDGMLLGHIVMGVKSISSICEEFGVPEEKSILLQHLVLTHHYYPEFGSPKKPMIMEGEIVHFVDRLDANLYDMDLALKNAKAGSFTAGVPTLDRRRLYKRNE